MEQREETWLQKSSIRMMVTVISFTSLGIGFLGPAYSMFVVRRFSASLLHAGILSAIFLSISAFFKMPAGRLVDLYGRWKVLFAGVIGCALSSLSYIFASELIHLYLIEFFFGISFALQRPALLALMMVMSGKLNRGLRLGIFDSTDDFAGAFAALLSGIVVSSLGFEPLFLLCFSCYSISGLFILNSRTEIG